MRHEKEESGPAPLARFIPAFYAPLNYLVNGTRGARRFRPRVWFFRGYPLALLPSTGPSWLVNGAAWERRKRKEKGKRDGRGRPDEREFPSSNLKWEWKARNWAFNDDKNWIVQARENEIDTQFLHKVYVDIKNKIYKTNFMCIKRGLTSFLRCIL